MLARTLGRTVDELAQTMSAQEFGAHFADYQREPWGSAKVWDVLFAHLCAVVVEASPKYAGKQAVNVEDFMIFKTRRPTTGADVQKLFNKG